MTTKRVRPTSSRVSTALVGTDVLYLHPSGKHYLATVESVRDGVARITYEANGKQVTASVTDAARLFSAD